MFFRLVPQLLEQGKVCIAESPLFEITTKKQTYFAYDETEKINILKEIGNQKYTIQRSKGLGENEPEMMWDTTMNPETRRLIVVTMEDAKNASEMFDLMLGNLVEPRKEYIAENGHKYLDGLDVQ